MMEHIDAFVVGLLVVAGIVGYVFVGLAAFSAAVH
jgi:hypothetical protein